MLVVILSRPQCADRFRLSRGRQAEQAGADGLAERADMLATVCGQVVPRNDVAGPLGLHQHLLEIGAERRSDHRPVEHHGRGHARQAQGAGKDRGFPISVWNRRAAALHESVRSGGHSSHPLSTTLQVAGARSGALALLHPTGRMPRAMAIAACMLLGSAMPFQAISKAVP